MIFVSAVFTAYSGDHLGRHDYTQKLLSWLRVLCSVVPVHVVCEPSLESVIREIPGAIAVPFAFEDTDIYKVMRSANRLPLARNLEKDTQEYMMVINGKPEYIRRVREAGYVSDRYVWIDAGIAKVLSDPPRLLKELVDKCETLPKDRIVIPGCWSLPCPGIHDRVCWRFCGGLFVVPDELVDSFVDATLLECARLDDLAIWEVNVWASVEHSLPILWTYGDHNDRLFDLKTDRPISNEKKVPDGSLVLPL
jgi:hypothetical protein